MDSTALSLTICQDVIEHLIRHFTLVFAHDVNQFCVYRIAGALFLFFEIKSLEKLEKLNTFGVTWVDHSCGVCL